MFFLLPVSVWLNIYYGIFFFMVWCVGQSYFDVFISDFAIRCRCALTGSAGDVKVGSIAEPGKTSSSSRAAGEWDEIITE